MTASLTSSGFPAQGLILLSAAPKSNELRSSLRSAFQSSETPEKPTVEEGLQSKDSRVAQKALYLIERMGRTKRTAIPALKLALWHPAFTVRLAAGKLLRTIVPSVLPAIQ